MNAVEALLTRLVDYAGLFPPASLEMERAVRNYQQYLAGDFSWMLGNFIIPAERLAEFTKVFQAVCCEEQEQPWTLSVVCAGESTPVDLQALEDFPEGAAFIASLEIRATDLRATRSVLAALPRGRAHYVEVAPEHLLKMLPLLTSTGARAKLRTGGVTAGAIPAPELVAQFLVQCAAERVPFKATAGLHHPVRSVHSLTYQLGSAEATMHGFLNVFLAAALAFHGSTESVVLETLTQEDPAVFRLDGDAIAWREHRMTPDQLLRARAEFAISFGSCSFTEPIDDLKAMEWL
jgi:hypothetical protein